LRGDAAQLVPDARRTAPVAPAPPAATDSDELDLDALFGLDDEEAVAPPPAAPSAAPPAPAPAEEEESADDLLAALMGSSEDDAPPPAAPAASVDNELADLFGDHEDEVPVPVLPVHEEKDAAPVGLEPEVAPAEPEPPAADDDDIMGFLDSLVDDDDKDEDVPAPPTEPAAEATEPSVDVDALMQQAVLAQVTGKPDDAKAHFEAILTAQPDHFRTLFLYGQFIRPTDPDRSKEMLERGRKLAAADGSDALVKQFDQELALLKPAEEEAPVAEAPVEEAPVEEAKEAPAPEPEPAPAPEPAKPAPAKAPAASSEEVNDAFEAASDFFELGKLDKARTRFQKVLEMEPGHAGALHMLGEIEMQGENWAAAAEWLKKSSESYADPEVLKKLASVLEKTGDQEAALETHLKLGGEADSQDAVERMLREKATAALESGEREEALEHLHRLLELQPDNAEALADALKVYQTWAEKLEEEGQFEAAQGVYRKQLEKNLETDKAREEIGRIYGAWSEHHESAKDYEKAVAVYESQLREDPAHEAAPREILRLYKDWAGTQVEEGDYEAAIAIMDRMLADHSGHADALAEVDRLHREWAQAHREANEFEPALLVYRRLAERSPDNAEVTATLKQVLLDWVAFHEEEGDYEQAIGTMHRLEKEHEKNAETSQRIAQLYRDWAKYLNEDGHTEAAQDVLLRLLNEQPETGGGEGDFLTLFKSRSEAKESEGDLPGAVAVWKELLEELPDSPQGLEEITRVYGLWAESLEGESKFEDAIARYRELEQYVPDRPEITEQIERLHAAWSAQEEKAGKWESALSIYEKLRQTTPNSPRPAAEIPRIYVGWAAALEGEGDYEEALGVVAKLLERESGHEQGVTERERLYRAWTQALEEDAQFDAAFTVLDNWLAVDPSATGPAEERVRLHLNAAAGMEKEKKYAEAIAELQKVDPERAAESVGRVYTAWASSQVEAGEFPTAIETLEAWRLQQPDSAGVRAQLVQTHRKWAEHQAGTSAFEEAIATYDKLIFLASGFEGFEADAKEAQERVQELFKQWAAHVEKEEGSEAALAIHARMVERNPESGDAPAEMARLKRAVAEELESSGKTEEALAAFVKLLEETGDESYGKDAVRLHFQLAEKAGAEQAIGHYEKVLTLAGATDEDKSRAEKALLESRIDAVVAKAAGGESDEADEFFREQLQLDPNNQRLHDALYKLYGDPSVNRKLVDFYRDLQKANPNENAFLLHLARAYCYVGKDTLAVVQFRKLVQSDPSAEVYVDLGNAYLRLKKPQEALKAVQSGLELDDKYLPAHVAKIKALSEDDLGQAKEAAAAAKDVPALEQNAAIKEWLDAVSGPLEAGEKPGEELLGKDLSYSAPPAE